MTKVLGILAGGYGKRAESVTKGEHKSLLKLPNKKTIISRLIEQASTNGIPKAYVVCFSPRYQPLIDNIESISSRLGINLVLLDQDPNKFYGTMFALRLVCMNVEANELPIIFEGDVVVSNTVAKGIFNQSQTQFVIDNRRKYDTESMKCVVKRDSIKFFSKEIKGSREFCGILALDKEMRNLFVSESHAVKIPNPFYEYVFNRIANKEYRLPYYVIPESEWNEVDDETDYQQTLSKYKLWKEVY